MYHARGPLSLLYRRGFVADATHSEQQLSALLANKFPRWWQVMGFDSHGQHGGDHDASEFHAGAERCRAAGLRRDEVPAVYCGFDPTADSLHVGNLLQMCALRALQGIGFRPIVLIGGATGMIGDPSGRSTERSLLNDEALAHNVEGIRSSLSRVVTFASAGGGGDPTDASIVNNASFYEGMSAIGFIRDVGRYFRVSNMLAKDSVKSRLDSQAGLSFTEFSYQLFQAHDFRQLFAQEQCIMQVGGGDQWGNITAGIDLIRRADGEEAVGVTIPLLTTPSGEKYGKSAGNAVWINEGHTSSYALYQHFLHTPDQQVEALLRLFTTVPCSDINEAISAHEAQPDRRTAQRLLARQVTMAVRGESSCRSAEQAGKVLFGGSTADLRARDLLEVAEEVPVTAMTRDAFVAASIADIALGAGLVSSKAEAKRLTKAGGLYLNNERVENAAQPPSLDDLIDGTVCLLRSGKRKNVLVRVEA